MVGMVIESQKYDAKVQAELWSVGAILYQLVIGRKLFKRNINFAVRAHVENFSELGLQCAKERLIFKEFSNHNLLRGSRLVMNIEQSQLHQSERSMGHQVDGSAS